MFRYCFDQIMIDVAKIDFSMNLITFELHFERFLVTRLSDFVVFLQSEKHLQF